MGAWKGITSRARHGRWGLVGLIAALLGPGSLIVRADALPAVVLNEVFYDAVGDDGDQEWVELFSVASEPVDLSGWKVERGGTTFTVVFTFPAGTTLVPGQFLLLGEPGVAGATFVADLSFQNGGEASDGVRLVDAEGRVVDVVLYDSPNANGLPDESGAPGSSFAPDVQAGQSLARVPDGRDTNVSAADFTGAATPTPGAPNAASAASSPTPSSSPRPELSGIVVTEVLPNPTGDDAAGEFIELQNTGGSSVDLGGAHLDDAEGGSAVYTIPNGTVLAPGAYRAFMRGDTKLALNNEGDSARLLGADGLVVSVLTYPRVPREGVAWVRQANSSGVWTRTVTPGVANVLSPIDDEEKDGGSSPTPKATAKAASPSPTATPRASPPVRGAVAGATGTPSSARSAPQGTTSAPSPVLAIREGRRAASGARGQSETSPEPTSSPTPSPTAAPVTTPPPSQRLPVSTMLAWAAAGVLGVVHLFRRAGS